MTVSINPTMSGGGALGAVESVANTQAKVMVTADIIFTVSAPVMLVSLFSECLTANDATASTLQYQAVPTVGTATTISGASASLASAVAGTLVVLNGTTLATAPDLVAVGVGFGAVITRSIIVPAGTIKLVVGVGSTTGTWKHYIRYQPLAAGAYVY